MERKGLTMTSKTATNLIDLQIMWKIA